MLDERPVAVHAVSPQHRAPSRDEGAKLAALVAPALPLLCGALPSRNPSIHLVAARSRTRARRREREGASRLTGPGATNRPSPAATPRRGSAKPAPAEDTHRETGRREKGGDAPRSRRAWRGRGRARCSRSTRRPGHRGGRGGCCGCGAGPGARAVRPRAGTPSCPSASLLRLGPSSSGGRPTLLRDATPLASRRRVAWRVSSSGLLLVLQVGAVAAWGERASRRGRQRAVARLAPRGSTRPRPRPFHTTLSRSR